MSDNVRDSYDAMAEEYAAFVAGSLEQDTHALDWLERFSDLAAREDGPIADLGCGPGHVVNHLSGLGLSAVGSDVSPGQIAEARKAYPHLEFAVSDMAALDHSDSSLGGIVSRYSIIHLPPSELEGVFAEWLRVLGPGAPLLVSFFASLSTEAHGTPFDHAVVTAYELSVEEVERQLTRVGFIDVETATYDPPEGGRPLGQGKVLARKPS